MLRPPAVASDAHITSHTMYQHGSISSSLAWRVAASVASAPVVVGTGQAHIFAAVVGGAITKLRAFDTLVAEKRCGKLEEGGSLTCAHAV